MAAVYTGLSIDVIRDMIKRRAIPYLMNGREYLSTASFRSKW